MAGANRYPALNTNIAENTLWVTKARDVDNLGTQTAPWVRFGFYSQGSTGGAIDIIGRTPGITAVSVSSNANNGVFGVRIPVSSDYAYTTVITDGGNYDANFQGNVENTTAADFVDDAAISRVPTCMNCCPARGYPAGRYLGYFELKADGTLTFNTIVPAPGQPTITNITRTGGRLNGVLHHVEHRDLPAALYDESGCARFHLVNRFIHRRHGFRVVFAGYQLG